MSSILDNISKSSENTEVDRDTPDFKSIRDIKEGADFLCNLGEPPVSTMTSVDAEGNVKTINIRVLTMLEEIKLHTLVQNYKAILPVKIDEVHKHISDIALYTIIKLMMATTPPMPSTATLTNYNACAGLSISTLENGMGKKVGLVLKEYESLENNFNPKINDLDKEDVQKMVEWVKKPETPLSVLTYEQSLIVLEYLLDQKELQVNL